MDNEEPSRALGGSPQLSASEGIHPLIAIGIGSAWPILVAFRSGESLSGSAAERLAFAAGLALVPAVIGFALAYGIGLRKAPLRWKLGGLLAIVLVAVSANFITVSLAAPASQEAPAAGATLQESSG